MKVVHILPALEQGGVESVVCDLNRLLVRHGHESVVISCGGRLTERILLDGGLAIQLEVKSKNPLTVPFRALLLRRELRRLRPDLVCVHSRVPAWLFLLANRTLHLPWISYAHGANSVSWYSAVMTKGDRVVVPSKFLAEYLHDNYVFDVSKLRVIPNAIDAERFDPENLDQAFIAAKREEWGIRQGQQVIMSIGRITKVKGFDELIRSTPKDVKLIIVGGADRHHRQYLDQLKAMAGENVVFAGQQEKIPECISLADKIVSANTVKPESFGLSLIEAYAMNKPVEARRFGGAAEIMSAVESRGGRSYREAVLDLYGFDRLAKGTLSAYEELIKEKNI